MAKRFKTLSDDEILRVIQGVEDYGCDPDRRPMLTGLYVLMANTGLRVSEAVALRWRSVDFERKELTVRTLKQQPKNGKKPETTEDTLPLDDKTIAALLTWKLPDAQPADLIFPISRRVAYNIFQRLLAYACIRPVKLHALRHSAVTRWLETTQDLTFAQAMARHKSVASTAQYVHCRRMKEQFAVVKPIG